MSGCLETERICGNYTDIPPGWGEEKMSANEIALLVVGILVDILIIIILFLISVCKFNDEIRFWYDSKMRETMPPYKKVADYLRGMEHESGGFKKREPSYSSSVSEMEPAYELLEERPTIVSAHERDRSLKSSHSKRLLHQVDIHRQCGLLASSKETSGSQLPHLCISTVRLAFDLLITASISLSMKHRIIEVQKSPQVKRNPRWQGKQGRDHQEDE
ncbi:hypothetical protein X801_10467, partial [Opisthorchis viverrini]